MRLKPEGPRALALRLEGFTHVCQLPIEGGICNEPLKLHKAQNGTWMTTKFIIHVNTEHPDHSISKKKQKMEQRAHDALVDQQMAFTPLAAADSKKRPLAMAAFVLNPVQQALSSQAHWYVYAQMHVSKSAFSDPSFIDMMRRQALSMLRPGACSPEKAPVLKVKQLKRYVRAEFDVFLIFLKGILEMKVEQSKGNAFAQLLHDGGTLKNHKKYQAFGMQLIDPSWKANLVICFGFPHTTSSKDKDVSALIDKTFKSRTGYSADVVFGSAISDRAAKGVSGDLDLEEEVCGMHDGDKLGQSATGALVRSKGKKVQNPFPEGVELMANAHSMAVHFSYGERHEELWQLGDAAAPGKVPHVRMKVDHNGTRVAAQHGLLHSELRLSRALPLYHAKHMSLAGSYVPASEKEKKLDWDADSWRWLATAEVEGVLDVTKITTQLSQYEQLYTGAFGTLIKGTTMRALRADTLHVVDLAKVDKQPRLIRKPVPVTSLSQIGQICRKRATLEGERRYCGNKTEELSGAPLLIGRRELLSTLLDLRTVGCAHLTSDQRHEAVDIFREVYVDFAVQAVAYDRAVHAAWEAKAQAQAKVVAEEAKAKACGAVSSSGAASSGVVEEEERKPKLDSGCTYGESQWSDEEEEDVGGTAALDEPEPPEIAQRAGYRIDADKYLKTWRKLHVDWQSEYPKPLQGKETLDTVGDLMPLDVGTLYNKIMETDKDRRLYGLIPLMATASFGQIGALNAESFCERVLRGAGHVLTEGNTLLDDKELEMLVILRMNRGFMRFMRMHYNELSKDHFQRTTVDEELGDEEPEEPDEDA